MSDNTNTAPPHVQAAAAIVNEWVTAQEQAQAQARAQPRVDAFDKFKRLERSDTPPAMPAWKDPRPELPERRWHNPRRA
jgi:hypothetical protein